MLLPFVILCVARIDLIASSDLRQEQLGQILIL